LSLQHLLMFIGTFEDVQVDVGVGVGGFKPMRESPSSMPSGPRVGLDCLLSSSSYSSSSASSSSSLCLRLHPPGYVLSLSLSVSLPLYISLSSLRVSPRMSLAKNLRQVQS
jgi:hypothetical protein